MKSVLLTMLTLVVSFAGKAQKSSIDLISYPQPLGWTKEEKKNVVVLTKTDLKSKTWCQIAVYRSADSKGSIEKDMESEWEELVVPQYRNIDSLEITETEEGGGWKIKAASAKFTFEKKPAAILLTTFSGYDRRVSILAILNSNKYLQEIIDFIGAIDIKAPDVLNAPESQPIANTNAVDKPENAPIAGTWIKSGSVTPSYGSPASWGVSGSTKDQYTFYGNGTYTFYSRSFAYSVDKLALVKEIGTYTIQGNNLTIRPATSVVESWSKMNGTDKWGSLTDSAKRNLETVTYTFTKHYFSGIQQWNLILQTGKPTNRDGSYGQNPAFSNAYFFAAPSPNNTPIELPPGY